MSATTPASHSRRTAPAERAAQVEQEVEEMIQVYGPDLLRYKAESHFQFRHGPQTSPVALPPDDMLTGDLTAPKWRVTSGGRIQVESKDEIRKRAKVARKAA